MWKVWQQRFVDEAIVRAVILVSTMLLGVSIAAGAQTLTVLHTFSGEGDGVQPAVGLTMDAAGNLYGTTIAGGPGRFGTVFKMTRRASGWEFTTLYAFHGGADGATPESRVIFGPDGTLYGTTNEGGQPGCGGDNLGCGVVFNLRPPASACKTAICYWTENVIYTFDAYQETGFPFGDIAFDRQGRLYGTAAFIYQLTPTNGGWVLNAIGGGSGSNGVVLDATGDLYSAEDNSTLVYRLVPSGAQWLQQNLYNLNGQTQGYGISGLTLDQAGNIYAGTTNGGPNGSGTVFELTSSNGSWDFNLLYAFSGNGFGGPDYNGSMTLDSTGNVYGTAVYDGANNVGSAFKLAPSDGGWSYTDLHDFHYQGSDGCYPNNSMAIDGSGNVYGTTGFCGANGDGVVFEITP